MIIIIADVKPIVLYLKLRNSVFRIFPGSPNTCPNGRNDYDPRVRPWYIAASSGPKDVILVLDTSGSMRYHKRLVSNHKHNFRVLYATSSI